MKKNLISVIILALVVANFVLSAILMFTIMPSVNKANELISRVCEAIDLDLNSGAATGIDNLPIKQIEVYDIDEGSTMNVNLKGGGYAVIAIAISVNNESEEYTENSAGTTILSTNESLIKDAINKILAQYTKEELTADRNPAESEILTYLRKKFGANYVVGIAFPTFMVD